jgi:flagellar basal-body rod modification protein FlgD
MSSIDPISLGAAGAAGAAAPSNPTNPSAGMGEDAFLKLLVAQLKYQDPMKPADSTEFLSQTAQFNTLEKLTDLGKQTADLLTTEKSLAAASLVGRQITAKGADGSDITGVVTAAKLGTDPQLEVGGQEVALSLVTQVQQ